jgi:hypothetical protein
MEDRMKQWVYCSIVACFGMACGSTAGQSDQSGGAAGTGASGASAGHSAGGGTSAGASGAAISSDAGQGGAADEGRGSDAGAAGQSGEPGGIGFPPSNVADTDVETSGVHDCVFSQPSCEIDTSSGTMSCQSGTAAPYRYTQITQSMGGVKAGLFVCHDVLVESASSVKVTGELPLVLVATGKIQIVGSLTATAKGSTAVAGGFAVASGNSKGAGPGGGSPGASGMGASGGGYCGKGGPGGVSPMLSEGGPAFGTAELIPLLGGASGGSDRTRGGAGGGAIELVAAQSIAIELTAVLSAGGGGADGNSANGPGGGSGGAILLEAPIVSVAGVLAVNGGGGGQGSGLPGGADGSPDASAALGAGSVGGPGSAGTALNGGAALAATGGGGGGAGRIRINTANGNATFSGTLSPAASTTCVTQGRISG